jgi:hypothetical protein
MEKTNLQQHKAQRKQKRIKEIGKASLITQGPGGRLMEHLTPTRPC